MRLEATFIPKSLLTKILNFISYTFHSINIQLFIEMSSFIQWVLNKEVLKKEELPQVNVLEWNVVRNSIELKELLQKTFIVDGSLEFLYIDNLPFYKITSDSGVGLGSSSQNGSKTIPLVCFHLEAWSSINPYLLEYFSKTDGLNSQKGIKQKIIDKTYKKLGMTCKNCKKTMPVMFADAITSLNRAYEKILDLSESATLTVDEFKEFQSRIAPLSYLNVYDVALRKPKVGVLKDSKDNTVLQFERSPTYWLPSSVMFPYGQAENWLLGDCANCVHAIYDNKYVDFVRMEGRSISVESQSYAESGSLVEQPWVGVIFEQVLTCKLEFTNIGQNIAIGSMVQQETATGRVVFSTETALFVSVISGNFETVSTTFNEITMTPLTVSEVDNASKRLRGNNREGWHFKGPKRPKGQDQFLSTYNFDDYQQNVIDKMSQRHTLLINHYMGTGKTLTTIATLIYLRKYVKDPIREAFIVIPNSIRSDWELEMAKWGIMTRHDIERGTRGMLYVSNSPGGLNVHIWSYEQAISNLSNEDYDYWDRMSTSVVVFDEAHRLNTIKQDVFRDVNLSKLSAETRNTYSRNMKKFIRMLEVAKGARFMLMLTGTPVCQRLFDVSLMLNTLSTVETGRRIFPTNPTTFQVEYLYLDQIKAREARFVGTHYKPIWGGVLGVMMDMGLGVLCTAFLGPAGGAVAFGGLKRLQRGMKESEKALAVTKPLDNQILYRVHEQLLRDALGSYVDYFNNEDFESSAKRYPYKVLRVEKVAMSSYQILLNAYIHFHAASGAKMMDASIIDPRVLDAASVDKNALNEPKLKKKMRVYFRRLDGEPFTDVTGKNYLSDIVDNIQTLYNVNIGMKQIKGKLYVVSDQEFVLNILRFKVYVKSSAQLSDVKQENVPGWFSRENGKVVEAMASQLSEQERNRPLVKLKGEPVGIFIDSERWYSQDAVEITFVQDRHVMTVGPYPKPDKKTWGFLKVVFETASEAVVWHDKPLEKYTVKHIANAPQRVLQWFRKKSSNVKKVNWFKRKTMSDIYPKDHYEVVPIISFNDELLQHKMSADIVDIPNAEAEEDFSDDSSEIEEDSEEDSEEEYVWKRPTTIQERFENVPIKKKGRKLWCLSPGLSETVFSEYERVVRHQRCTGYHKPPVNSFEVRASIAREFAEKWAKAVDETQLLRLGNIAPFPHWPSKWEIMYEKYLIRGHNCPGTKIVSYRNGIPEVAEVNPNKIQWEQGVSVMPPRSVVYSQFSEGRGGIYNLGTFLLQHNAVQYVYRKQAGNVMEGWIHMGDDGRKVFSPINTNSQPLLELLMNPETLRFALIDNEIKEERFEFTEKQEVVYNFEVWTFSANEDETDYCTIVRKGNPKGNPKRVKKVELRPNIMGNRSEENKHITELYNGTDKRVIDCILLHYSITEGKSFKRVRQIHILEPIEDAAQWEQVVARAVRKDSHKPQGGATVIYSEPYVEVVQWHAFIPGFKNIPGDTSVKTMLSSAPVKGSLDLVISEAMCFIMDFSDFVDGQFIRLASGSYSNKTTELPGRVMNRLGVLFGQPGLGKETDHNDGGWMRKLGNRIRNWTGHFAADTYDDLRVKQQETDDMKDALDGLKKLWREQNDALRTFRAQFQSQNNEKSLALTADDFAMIECEKRLDYMKQWRLVVYPLYNPMMKQKKSSLEKEAEDVAQLKEEQMDFDKHTTMSRVLIDDTGKFIEIFVKKPEEDEDPMEFFEALHGLGE